MATPSTTLVTAQPVSTFDATLRSATATIAFRETRPLPWFVPAHPKV